MIELKAFMAEFFFLIETYIRKILQTKGLSDDNKGTIKQWKYILLQQWLIQLDQTSESKEKHREHKMSPPQANILPKIAQLHKASMSALELSE